MKRIYEEPFIEIEKFTVASTVITASTTEGGWGEGGDEYEDF